MSDKVVEFTGSTLLDLDAERVLASGIEVGLEAAIVVGYKEDGNLYFASSLGDEGKMLWLLEKAKQHLLR